MAETTPLRVGSGKNREKANGDAEYRTQLSKPEAVPRTRDMGQRSEGLFLNGRTNSTIGNVHYFNPVY